MRHLARNTLVVVFCLVSVMHAQNTATTNFRPLEFLVGHCWIGTFPDGKQTDEHCFEWVYDKKFVRDRHVVRGGPPYEGESLYAWDATQKRITFSYWNSSGDVSTGSVEDTADGLVFPQKHETASGTMELKTIWTRPNPKAYHVWVGQRVGSEWKTLWTMDLNRKT